MTNGHNPAHALISPTGAPLVQDIKTQRVKLVIVTQAFIAQVLAMTGKTALKCIGIPEGAECVGMSPVMKNAAGAVGVGLIYYHPSFPISIPGRMPPMLTVTTEEYELSILEDELPDSESPDFYSATGPDVDDGE